MRVALAGGGTGGHIYPCLAVAEILKTSKAEDGSDIELFYIGQADKLEAELVQERHPYIAFFPIKASSPSKAGKNPFKLISWFMEFAIATDNCKRFIKDNKIDIVFGTGGYAAAPAFAAAILTKTPYIIHNLDASIGLANKVFIKDAAAATLAFPVRNVKPRNGNVMVAGNPVSAEFFKKLQAASSTPISDSQFTGILNKDSHEINILITGGSQGAQNINNMIGEILPELLSKSKLSITHVTGAKLFDDYLRDYLDGDINKYPNYTVMPYTHAMPELCAKADISICRSGAMTIAEMAASNTVSMFIPLPWAAQDHQTTNAQALVDANAAIMLREKELSPQLLLDKIYELITDEDKLYELKTNLEQFAKPYAARNLAELIIHIAAEN